MPLLQEVCDSFEHEMQRVAELTSAAPPMLSAGRPQFFSSLNDWMHPTSNFAADTVVVLPDPSLNLSLPYPEDEFFFAARKGKKNSKYSFVSHLLHRAGIGGDVLRRPVTSLSGGERMLISLIKASCLAGGGRGLVVCSPFYWLDTEHRQFAMQLLNYSSKSCDVRLLVMDGEIGPGTSFQRDHCVSSLPWEFICSGAAVLFPASRFPRETPAKRIEYVLSDGRIKLHSPTLISGVNGIGKSTFAKVLAGLVKAKGTPPEVIVSGFNGRQARLVMQDSVIQLFGDSPKLHLERVFMYDKKLLEKALTLFTTMQSNCAKSLTALNPSWSIGDKNNPNSIFQAKLALVAERLVSYSPLLILDEPGWCLSKASSQLFLSEAVKQAHEQGTAVAFISHQGDWWEELAMSELHLCKTSSPDQVTFICKGGHG